MNKQTTLSLLVTGEAACFRRPEFSDDLVTYDVMPPTVAHRLLDAAFPTVSDRLSLRKIIVLNPIRSRWQNIVTTRGSRRALVLLDVSYLIQATIHPSGEAQRGHDLPSASGIPALPVKAHLGLADFLAILSVPRADELPKSTLVGSGSLDLGWVLSDIARGARDEYRRLTMRDGEIDLAEQDDLMRAS